MNIVNVGYDSTNYYTIEFKGGKLLVDCGWPGTLPKLTAELKRKGISLSEIKQNDNLILKLEESREFLAGIGLSGEILHTPGHSDDSITLILDEGFAFTGDLPPRFIVAEEDHVTHESCDKIY